MWHPKKRIAVKVNPAVVACRIWFILFSIAVSVSGGLGTSLFADELAPPPAVTTKVHYRLANRNCILVVAYPNRQDGGQFLFDTGTNQTVIVRSVAKRLHLEMTDHLDSRGAVIKSALDGKPEQYAILPQLQVGEIVFTSLPCLIVDDDSLYAVVGSRVEGIIGANVLKEAVIDIDFKSQDITIISRLALTDNDLQRLQFNDAKDVPFVFTEEGLPSVSLSLQWNGVKSNEDFVVDTGALTTNISAVTAKSLNLRGNFQIHQLDIMSGERILNYSFVDKVSCADFNRKNVAVYFPDQDQAHDAHPHLGLDFLASYSILFDAGRGKLYFKSIPAHKP